MVVVLHLACIV